MAGHHGTGPASRGEEEVDYQLLKADVIRLRRANHTHAEIGAELGLERSTITKMIKRIMREMLAEAGVEEVRAMELNRLEKITERMWPRLDPANPDDIPDNRTIQTYLMLSKAKRDLVGADVPKQLAISGVGGDEEESDEAKMLAARIARFADLADRVAAAGIGSGRAPLSDEERAKQEAEAQAEAQRHADLDNDVVEAELVDSPDDDVSAQIVSTPINTPLPDTAPFSNPENTNDSGNTWSTIFEEVDNTNDDPPGHWVDGRWVED